MIHTENEPVEWHPALVEFRDNWEKYGFNDPREGFHYGWRSRMKAVGLGHPWETHTAEMLLKTYPIELFRKDFVEGYSDGLVIRAILPEGEDERQAAEDVLHGRVKQFADIREAMAYLDSLKKSD